MKHYIKYITIIITFVLLLTGCDFEEEEVIKLQDNQIGKIKYSIPNTFKKSELSSDNVHIYKYNDEHIGTVCNFTITATTPFNTNLDIIIKSYMFSDDDYIIKEEKIDNQVWKYASDNRKTDGLYYAYATIYQDKLYVIQYDDIGTDSYCKDMFKKITKSIKVEE